MTFCHAVGLGFLLLEVLEPPMPDPAAWEHLIARLLAATGDPAAFAQTATAEAKDPDT